MAISAPLPAAMIPSAALADCTGKEASGQAPPGEAGDNPRAFTFADALKIAANPGLESASEASIAPPITAPPPAPAPNASPPRMDDAPAAPMASDEAASVSEAVATQPLPAEVPRLDITPLPTPQVGAVQAQANSLPSSATIQQDQPSSALAVATSTRIEAADGQSTAGSTETPPTAKALAQPTPPTLSPSLPKPEPVPTAPQSSAREPGHAEQEADPSAEVSPQPQLPVAIAAAAPHPLSLSSPTAATSLQAAPGDGVGSSGTEPAAPTHSRPAPRGDLAATNAPAENAPPQAMPEPGLSSPLFTQTLEAAARPSSPTGTSPYAPAPQAGVSLPVQEGRFGADIGVTIARAVKAGPNGAGGDARADLLIRLDPRHMGRVDVRLSFEHDGLLRAVVSADSPAALDMLRRESADLSRALTDAGVRADSQSLRFDANGAGGGMSGQHRHPPQRQAAATPGPTLDFAGNGSEDPLHGPLRSSGRIDLMA